MMSEFDDIRPYNDDEVPQVLDRLVRDRELLDSLIRFKLGGMGRRVAPLLRPLVRSRLLKQTSKIRTVADFQASLEALLVESLDKSCAGLSVSGLDNLDSSQSYLFVSNHRDIAMDPALVNLTLYRNGFTTLRIAIGDNLLTKPFASDLMRLNKSFIVNRSAKAPREKLKAAKLLSAYIHKSVLSDHENVWIAQREGRAKDGRDHTNPAVIGMLCLHRSKEQSLADYIRDARIVPVSISYEYDPCDMDKARELYIKKTFGEYSKAEHEDVQSIARGITGFKGRVHLAFCPVLNGAFDSSEDVSEQIDRDIISHYVLHPSNCIAYEMLNGKAPSVLVGAQNLPFDQFPWREEREFFAARLANVPKDHHQIFLQTYANPVVAKLGRN